MNNKIIIITLMLILFSIFTHAITNPAVQICQENNNSYKIMNDYESNEYGVCITKDGEIIDAWEYYENNKFAQNITNKSIENKTINVSFDKSYRDNKLIRKIIPLTLSKEVRSAKSTYRSTIPSKFDWRNHDGKNWVSPVKDQGACGSCWAFADVACIESRIKINLNDSDYNIDLSEQDLISCSDAGSCAFGYYGNALDYVKNHGIVKESCFGYTATNNDCSNKCANWENEVVKANYRIIEPNVASIKEAISNTGPVVADMVLCGDLTGNGVYSHSGNVFLDESCWNIIDDKWYIKYHVITLVGYSDVGQYWIAKNSWGSNWGDNGFFKISYSQNIWNYSTWWDNGVNGNGDSSVLILDICIVITATDLDDDNIDDSTDNCPEIPNLNQSDIDNDGMGDVCDYDSDNDGVLNTEDCEPLNNLIFPGAEEICNNLDDDCNNIIDNIIETEDCGMGICSGGQTQRICEFGQWSEWSTCSTSHLATEETCDGTDEDCDGTLDGSEDLSKQCGIKKIGICTFGIEVCDNDGNWINCNATFPEEEICSNQIDEDCDGSDYSCCNNINIYSPFPDNYSTRKINFNFSLGKIYEYLKYIDLNDQRSRNRTLCRDCDEYGYDRRKFKSFRDGFHNLSFYSIDEHEVCENTVEFFIDSTKPKISKTEPRRGYTSGNFYVEFTEENPKNLILTYGNSYINETINLSKCYEVNRGRRGCDTLVNLSNFEGKEIDYWFTMEDIAGNSISSRTNTLEVDQTNPIIDYFNYTIDRRRVQFNISVIEKNFDTVDYIDYEDRSPRWRSLCRRLSDGLCLKKKSFRSGFHNLSIIAEDEAGNNDTISEIVFNI